MKWLIRHLPNMKLQLVACLLYGLVAVFGFKGAANLIMKLRHQAKKELATQRKRKGRTHANVPVDEPKRR